MECRLDAAGERDEGAAGRLLPRIRDGHKGIELTNARPDR